MHREIALNLGRAKIAKIGHKNGLSSKSVNSFDSGAIFLHRSGQDLSRDVVVVSVYAFLEKVVCRYRFGYEAQK